MFINFDDRKAVLVHELQGASAEMKTIRMYRRTNLSLVVSASLVECGFLERIGSQEFSQLLRELVDDIRRVFSIGIGSRVGDNGTD